MNKPTKEQTQSAVPGEAAAESMLVALVRSTAEAFTYARLYGRPITEASEVGRQEALDAMTAEDVFQALDIVVTKGGQFGRDVTNDA